jgi:hypothetical protein
MVLFALEIDLIFEIDNKDTDTATATYAAVLVDFVDTREETKGLETRSGENS